jgi:hypothetical protein
MILNHLKRRLKWREFIAKFIAINYVYINYNFKKIIQRIKCLLIYLGPKEYNGKMWLF